MDEVFELCVRILGSGPAAAEAADVARGAGEDDRLAQLAAAVTACRERASQPRPVAEPAAGGGLAVAVAREIEEATAALSVRQREGLALRELAQLPYADIAAVTGNSPETVGSLLAEARLGLRAARRGPLPEPSSGCRDRNRALRLLAARGDGETMAGDDEEWLHRHLMACEECEIAHGAMLEASLCYRGWRT